jgi:hypothetical protein
MTSSPVTLKRSSRLCRLSSDQKGHFAETCV